MVPKSRQARKTSPTKIGNSGLRFEINWSHKAKSTEGYLSVFVDDITIWEDLFWNLGDLLEFLTTNLTALQVSQVLPGALTRQKWGSLPPFRLSDWELRRTGDESDEVIEQEAKELYDFLCQHDLAKAFSGGIVDPLVIIREGNMMRIRHEIYSLLLPLQETLINLKKLGDHIFEKVKTCPDFYDNAHSNWLRVSREAMPAMTIIRFASGLATEEIHQIQGSENGSTFWEIQPHVGAAKVEGSRIQDYYDSELLAAARMSREALDISEMKALIFLIKGCNSRPTQELDELSDAACSFMENQSGAKPHAQGQLLARWFREKIKQDEVAVINFEEVIKSWNVELREISLASTLDAIGAWGPSHGPAILINRLGKHNKDFGKRTTLAHEICHLLVDRRVSLPLVEVLGGDAPYQVEARANSFAAEMVIPMKTAVAEWMKRKGLGFDAKSIYEAVRDKFQVTAHVFGNQLRNASDLTEDHKKQVRLFLNNITSRYDFND